MLVRRSDAGSAPCRRLALICGDAFQQATLVHKRILVPAILITKHRIVVVCKACEVGLITALSLPLAGISNATNEFAGGTAENHPFLREP